MLTMMNSEYPPLPRSKALEGALGTLSLSGSEEALSNDTAGAPRNHTDAPAPSTRVISSSGDVAVEYTDPASNPPVSYRWQVSNSDLVKNSPYFRALLDPNKFAEGQQFMRQKATLGQITSGGEGHERNDDIEGEIWQRRKEEENVPRELLPTVSLPVGQSRRRLGIDVVELFLRVLSLSSFDEEDRHRLYGELKFQPPSIVARLIELADILNSPDALRMALRECGYSFFGRGKISLTRFSPSLLKSSEDRIRHVIFIAMFLEEQAIFQVFTHTLIIMGSKFWVNGVASPDLEGPRWRHFQNGLEGMSILLCD